MSAMTGGSVTANVVKTKLLKMQSDIEELQAKLLAKDEDIKIETALREAVIILVPLRIFILG